MRPTPPLRENVAMSTRRRKTERQGERHLEPMPARQPQIDRRQREERHDQHHAEVVRVSGERVDPVDVLAVDCAVDVDLGRAARERVEDEVVEAVAGDLGAELEDPVDGVRDEADREPAERAPEEPLPALREVADRRDEEGEVDDELRHPFRELGQPLLRVDVPEPREIDEREGREEAEHDRARSRQRAALGRDVRDQEQDRRDVVEPDLAGDVPVHLLEGRDEEGGEEEPRHDPLLGARHGDGAAGGERGGGHARLLSRSASSSTRPPRASRVRHSSESGVPSRLPACQRRWRSSSASRKCVHVVGWNHDAGSRVAHELRGRAVGRDGGEDRPLGREVLEDLPGQDAAAAAAGLRDQEEQRL